MKQYIVFFISFFLLFGFGLSNEAKAGTVNTMDIQNVYMDIRDFGAKANDQADDSAAIMSAIQKADQAGGGTVFLPAGTYQVSAIKATVRNPISIVGEPGTVLDGKRSTQPTLVSIGGTRQESAPLTTNAVKGSHTINTALSIAPGDIVLLHSTDLFNPARSYYYRGELAEVQSVAGNDITLTNPLFDTYNAASTVVYKLTMPKISITNLMIERDSSHAGLIVQYAKDVQINNVEVAGARERGIGVAYAYGGTLEKNEASDCWYEGSGTSYGLSIASSQHLMVKNNWFHGGRHGLSLGGQEPTRDITITQNVIDNYEKSRVGALNTHENVEYINVSQNEILNGVSTVGDYLTFENNNITTRVDYPGIIVKQNWNSDQLVFRNNKITAPDHFGILLETYLPSLEVQQVLIEGNTIRSKSAGIGIKPRTETATDTKIKNLIIRNNNIVSSIDSAISIRNYKQTPIEVTNMTVEGGTYTSTANKGIFAQIAPTSGQVAVNGATIRTDKNTEYGMMLIHFKRIAIDASRIEGPATLGNSSFFQYADNVVITNSKLSNWSYKNGIRTLNVAQIQMENNTYENTPF
ncbi:right-handed parallel beta-helix repeat-containing protein [Aneurinibacillus sp. REN35]|uniref:right-handed parallel beta-helix repeat-containing protein n=1 Tax=Aneurinibacillus sp. REN35 TaxID=3237286 RepID=UPI0035283C37